MWEYAENSFWPMSEVYWTEILLKYNGNLGWTLPLSNKLLNWFIRRVYKENHAPYLGTWAAGSWQILHGLPHARCCRHLCSWALLDCSPGSLSHSQTQTLCALHDSQRRRSRPMPAGPRTTRNAIKTSAAWCNANLGDFCLLKRTRVLPQVKSAAGAAVEFSSV